ncbi:LamG-like jellyroll fold domain-containing protein [Massilia timonae]|uniref:LamG-like jellyroll fold domain-containing protein n=1 Tax=Massilia timonae TaxID=47229 RepID=UPI0028D8BB89|nr:LamG-like jellyroll fold domain-containing protein [Massilia timonae]
MNTLIFKAPRAMSAPIPGTPTLPLIGDDWELALFASDFVDAYADGAIASSLTARGATGTSDARTFKTRAGWSGAVLDHDAAPGGKPAFIFNGNASMEAQLYILPQPSTVVVMVRVDEYAANTTPRIFSGVGGGINSIDVLGQNKLRLRAWTNSPGQDFNGPPIGVWTPIVAVFNGAQCKVKVGNGSIATFNETQSEPASLVALGASTSQMTANGAGFKGGIAELRRFARALSNEEIDALVANMYQKYVA